MVEVVLALSILAVVVLLAVGALRVGLRAWEAGERQSDRQQESRALFELLVEAVEGAYPYRTQLGPQRVVLFQGEAEQLRFVTTAPPVALEGGGAPFHAVVLGPVTTGRLPLRERLLPAEAPFEGGVETVLARRVSHLRFAYRGADGTWRDRWDGQAAEGLPVAVRLELAVGTGRWGAVPPTTTVSLALGKRTP